MHGHVAVVVGIVHMSSAEVVLDGNWQCGGASGSARSDGGAHMVFVRAMIMCSAHHATMLTLL